MYKRQLVYWPIPAPPLCWFQRVPGQHPRTTSRERKPLPAPEIRREAAQETNHPTVSYTHLDVYKRQLLYGVTPGSPVMALATLIVLLAVLVLAFVFPAGRAASIDPMEAIRDE